MLAQGVGDVIVCNRRGALYPGAKHPDAERAALAEHTKKVRPAGHARGGDWPAPTCCSAVRARRGVGAVVRGMTAGAVVFAMANPVPEVRPEAVRDDVAISATGRSDYPKQINNVLAFPGVSKERSRCARARPTRR
jgi:malate dehydrogenase (oxaloacetate-decarboxylating)